MKFKQYSIYKLDDLRKIFLTSSWRTWGFFGIVFFTVFCCTFGSTEPFFCMVDFGGLPGPESPITGLFGLTATSFFFACWPLPSLAIMFASFDAWGLLFRVGLLPWSRFLVNSPLCRGSEIANQKHNHQSQKWGIQTKNRREKAS